MRKAQRLSKANRDLINTVDLDEPQMRPEPDQIASAIRAVTGSGVLNALMEPAPLPKPLERPRAPVAGTGTGRKGKPPITEDQRLEIAHAYEQGEPVLTIARRHDVARGTVLNIAAELGVTRPVAAPKEAAMPDKTSPVVSPPPVEKAPTNGVVTGLTEWTVTYTVTLEKTVTVHAKGFGEAASAATGAIMSGLDGEPFEIVSVAKKVVFS